MTIVIDASVAVKWVLPENGSEAASSLLSEELIAPTFWLLEAASVLWRRQRRGEMSVDQAGARLLGLINAPVAPVPIEPHIERSLKLAAELDHPVYDCLYLAIAIKHDTHVVTADRRFAAVADRESLAGFVRLLGT